MIADQHKSRPEAEIAHRFLQPDNIIIALPIAVHQITGPRHRELILHHTRNNNITSCSAVLTTRRTAGAAAPPTKETELVQQWTLDRPEPLTSDPTDHREATDTKTPALPSAGSPIREPDGPLTEIYNSLTPTPKTNPD